MVAIPKPETSIADSIYEAIEKREEKELRLSRIGASGIGGSCLREIWYSWRVYDDKKFDGRMLRLFQTGHLQEDRILSDLKLAGYTVWDRDDNGEQPTFTDETGHFVAKLDGVIKGVPGSEKTPHDLEIKTHSLKSFDDVVKKGVEVSKPLHYAQMQAGMMLSDGSLKRALYVALCKNDERYHVERIREDLPAQDVIRKKVIKLVEATIPPVGISADGKSFECKWCDMKAVCLGEKEPIVTCRSCRFSVVGKTNGEWLCGNTGAVLTNSEQLKACESYEVLS